MLGPAPVRNCCQSMNLARMCGSCDAIDAPNLEQRRQLGAQPRRQHILSGLRRAEKVQQTLHLVLAQHHRPARWHRSAGTILRARQILSSGLDSWAAPCRAYPASVRCAHRDDNGRCESVTVAAPAPCHAVSHSTAMRWRAGGMSSTPRPARISSASRLTALPLRARYGAADARLCIRAVERAATYEIIAEFYNVALASRTLLSRLDSPATLHYSDARDLLPPSRRVFLVLLTWPQSMSRGVRDRILEKKASSEALKLPHMHVSTCHPPRHVPPACQGHAADTPSETRQLNGAPALAGLVATSASPVLIHSAGRTLSLTTMRGRRRGTWSGPSPTCSSARSTTNQPAHLPSSTRATTTTSSCCITGAERVSACRP